MALGLRHWIGGTLAACGLTAVALLPPKESEQREQWRNSALKETIGMESGRVPARATERRLLRASSRAQERYLLLQLRDSIMTAVARMSPQSDNALLLLFDRRLPAPVPEVVTRPVERIWDEMAPRGNEIRTVVAFVVDTTPGLFGVPRRAERSIWQLVPAATDGRTCLVLYPLGRYGLRELKEAKRITTRTVLRGYESRQGLLRILGPCAYYAAFGAPGNGLRQWLDSTEFFPALTPDLAPRSLEPAPATLEPLSSALFGRRFAPWDVPVVPAACAAGNAALCRAYVANGLDGPRRVTRFPGVVDAAPYWGANRTVYLADLVVDMGRDRFAAFWRSNAPLETAFEEAFGTTLASWTQRWARAHVGAVTAGPAPSLLSAMISVLVIGIVVASGAFYATRREVR